MDPETLSAARMALLFALVAALACPPALYLLRESGEKEEPEPWAREAKIPMDDERRSPDWCHAHGKTERKDK